MNRLLALLFAWSISAANAASIDIPACDTLAITSQTPDVVTLACGHNPPPPTGTYNILVVPLRYQSPPSTDIYAVRDYNSTLALVTQTGLISTFSAVSNWYLQETYGQKSMSVTVYPEVTLPGNPLCDTNKVYFDAKAVIGNTPYNALVIVTPYSCWLYHMTTQGNVVYSTNTYQNSQGTYAHELGHAFGLLHNAVRMPTYTEYGSGVDQMGSVAGNLLHFLAYHKQRLGVLTPKPCASATLRSIYQYPDAIACGSGGSAYIIDYLPEWQQVWVHKTEFVSTSHGGSDTTDVAKLSAGQSYSAGGFTFTHNGGGNVTIQ